MLADGVVVIASGVESYILYMIVDVNINIYIYDSMYDCIFAWYLQGI